MRKAFFISDLHLGATYNGKSRELELAIVAFLDSIKGEAEEIFLLGDILDYWYEYKHVVPKGYVRFLGKLAELADSGVKITWIIGNHDIWIFDYLPEELGIKVIDGILNVEIFGVPFSMQHGDGIGGDRKFRFLRSLFRNRFCQRLYSNIHPRWTVGFAYACSRKSRTTKEDKDYKPKDLVPEIRQWCEDMIKNGDPAKYFIFGHLHKLHNENLPDGRKLLVVPDWPSSRIYGVFDGENFKLEKFEGAENML